MLNKIKYPLEMIPEYKDGNIMKTHILIYSVESDLIIFTIFSFNI